MRKLVVAGIAACIFAPFSYGTMIGHYALNEASGNAVDETGNTGPAGPAGTLGYGQASVTAGAYGALTVTPAIAASFGTSIDFNPGGIGNLNLGVGDDAPVTGAITAGGVGGVGSLTLMAWINPDAGVDLQIVASTGNSVSGWKLMYRNSGVMNFVANGVIAQSDNGGTVGGVWNHVAVTYDDGALEFFLNGVSNGSGAWTGFTEEAGGGETKIGGRFGGTENFFGRIDEVKYFDTVLAPSEIQREALGLSVVPEPGTWGLVALGGFGLALRRRSARD